METSANADGFYFSVRSTRPVLLTRVRVGLRDGTAPTTVRVAVRRGGAAKRPQATQADWALWAAVGRATVESTDCVVDLALPVPVAPHSDLCVHASGRRCATTPSLAASPPTGVEICDCSAYSGAAPFFVEGGALVGGALCGGVDFDDCDEAAWREELAEFIRRRGDHFMSC